MSKGLTDQELLDLLMRDDDSVIGGLSDDEDVGWDNEYVASTEVDPKKPSRSQRKMWKATKVFYSKKQNQM
jgi:hypothetical protein